MSHATPDEWLFEDWQLIARALLAYQASRACSAYESDTIDAMLGAIAYYLEVDEQTLIHVLGHSNLPK